MFAGADLGLYRKRFQPARAGELAQANTSMSMSRDLARFFIGACRRNAGRGRDHKVAHLAAGRDARRHDFDHGLYRRRCSL